MDAEERELRLRAVPMEARLAKDGRPGDGEVAEMSTLALKRKDVGDRIVGRKVPIKPAELRVIGDADGDAGRSVGQAGPDFGEPRCLAHDGPEAARRQRSPHGVDHLDLQSAGPPHSLVVKPVTFDSRCEFWSRGELDSSGRTWSTLMWRPVMKLP
jgi:hypothetical protein